MTNRDSATFESQYSTTLRREQHGPAIRTEAQTDSLSPWSFGTFEECPALVERGEDEVVGRRTRADQNSRLVVLDVDPDHPAVRAKSPFAVPLVARHWGGLNRLEASESMPHFANDIVTFLPKPHG